MCIYNVPPYTANTEYITGVLSRRTLKYLYYRNLRGTDRSSPWPAFQENRYICQFKNSVADAKILYILLYILYQRSNLSEMLALLRNVST